MVDTKKSRNAKNCTVQSGRLRMICAAQWTDGISRATFSVRCSTVIFRRTLPAISIRAKLMQATQISAMKICLMQRQSRHEKGWYRKRVLHPTQ